MKFCRYFHRFIALAFFTAISLMPLTALRAQDPMTGAIEGYVLDSATRAPIAGALVQIINVENGAVLSKITNDQGYFRQGLMPPGDYRIRVSKEGYVSPRDYIQTNWATRSNEIRVPILMTRQATAVAQPTTTPVQPVSKPSPQIDNSKLSTVIGTGRYYALVIGNNNYQHAPKLKMAEADARAVVSMLQERFGFTAKLKLDATRQDILSEINNYRRTLEADDNLLIYYAGHGYYDREVDRAYWLPVDARLEDNANWISADDITGNIRGVPGKHILIVSDSCYSGTISRDLGLAYGEPSARDRFLQKMMAGKSRTLMASGGNEPVLDGGGSGHSVFARAFLTALEQTDKDAFTATEAFRDFVQERVAGGASQTPEYNPLRNSGHESGDFVFIRKRP